jgi:hypothetical protein
VDNLNISLVKADREVVEAIFTLQEQKERRSAWSERFIGANFGVISSLVATVIWRLI